MNIQFIPSGHPISYLGLVAGSVHHHFPVRSVIAVAQPKLLHEYLVITVFATLDDQTSEQFLLTQIYLKPLIHIGLGLRQQRPSRPAGQQTGIL